MSKNCFLYLCALQHLFYILVRNLESHHHSPYLASKKSLLDSHALPRASGPRQSTRNPRQRLCRGLPSAKTPRGIFRRRRGLCRGSGRPSAKKRTRYAPAPLAVSLPRADPRQISGFFLNFFCRGPALGKEFFFNLCRGPPPWPSAKKFSGFFKKIFAEGYC